MTKNHRQVLRKNSFLKKKTNKKIIILVHELHIGATTPHITSELMSKYSNSIAVINKLTNSTNFKILNLVVSNNNPNQYGKVSIKALYVDNDLKSKLGKLNKKEVYLDINNLNRILKINSILKSQH